MIAAVVLRVYTCLTFLGCGSNGAVWWWASSTPHIAHSKRWRPRNLKAPPPGSPIGSSSHSSLSWRSSPTPSSLGTLRAFSCRMLPRAHNDPVLCYLDSWTLYFAAKLLFIIWLQLPQTKGTSNSLPKVQAKTTCSTELSRYMQVPQSCT